jgi:hypothetical protein
MKQQKFRVAGWAAVIAAAAFAVEIVLSLLAETPAYAGAISPGLVVLALAVHVLMGSFAMWRLREFLHETCDFHGVDALVPWVIGGGILLAAVLAASRLGMDESLASWLLPGIGVPVGILGMLFGYRLLAANGTLGGYRNAFAWIHIIAPICFVTLVLAPIGLLLLIVAQVLLAVMLFSEDKVELEFV